MLLLSSFAVQSVYIQVGETRNQFHQLTSKVTQTDGLIPILTGDQVCRKGIGKVLKWCSLLAVLHRLLLRYTDENMAGCPYMSVIFHEVIRGIVGLPHLITAIARVMRTCVQGCPWPGKAGTGIPL